MHLSSASPPYNAHEGTRMLMRNSCMRWSPAALKREISKVMAERLGFSSLYARFLSYRKKRTAVHADDAVLYMAARASELNMP